jgi:hypothetical protein
MAKREFVLITGFAAAGFLAWQLTAPPVKPGDSGFSFASLRTGLQNLRGAHVRAEVRKSATLMPAGAVTRVHLPEIAGEVDIQGRTDEAQITAELEGAVFVADPAEVSGAAEQVSLTLEQQGDQVRVVLSAPAARRNAPRFRLLVRMPSAAGATLVLSGERLNVRDIAALRAEVRRAQTSIAGIAGLVELEQRNGSAEIERIGSLVLESRRATIDVRGVASTVRGEVTDGRVLVRQVAGDVELESRRAGVEVEDARAGVRLTAQDGIASMRRVEGPVRYEGRRCGLTLENETDVMLDATSTDEHLQLRMPARALTLDITADEGAIDLPGDGFPAVVREGGRHRAAGVVGAGGPLVKIRGYRSQIVLRR